MTPIRILGALMSTAALAGCITIVESILRSEGMAEVIYVKPPEGRRTDVLLQFAGFAKGRGMRCALPPDSPPELVTMCTQGRESHVALTSDGGRLKFLVFGHPDLLLKSGGEELARKYVGQMALGLRSHLQAAFGSAVSSD